MTAPAAAVPGAPPGVVARPRASTGRNTELFLLCVVVALLLVYAAAVEGARVGHLTGTFWVQPILLGIAYLGIHLAVRFLAPFADPVLLPCVALLNGIGVGFQRRMDFAVPDTDAERAALSPFTGWAFRQLGWTLAAAVAAILLLAIIRDHRTLARYAYTFGLAGLLLVIAPLPFPAINGAKLWVTLGPVSIQPGEFAKLALMVFFANYLMRKREVLSLASKRFAGIDFPRARDLGPVLVVWLFSMLVLIFEKDLGTALMYFGMFVVTLYIATERVSWIIIGLGMFAIGAVLAHAITERLQLRVAIWLNPFEVPRGEGYGQMQQSLFSLGTGGLFGSGPGAGLPGLLGLEARNDFITAGLGEEIGMFGLAALLTVLLVIVGRGLRIAVALRDSFGKLLAGGLAFTLGLQVFVIVGGVSNLIPMTGLTTPFLSAGGSALTANLLLVALLLRMSDAGRRPAGAGAPGGPGPTKRAPEKLQDVPTEVIRL